MIIICDFCCKELAEPGALFFSPPYEDGKTMKFHICKPCWDSDNFTFQRKPTRQLERAVIDKTREYIFRDSSISADDESWLLYCVEEAFKALDKAPSKGKENSDAP